MQHPPERVGNSQSLKELQVSEEAAKPLSASFNHSFSFFHDPFSPKETATRAQVATILMRLQEKVFGGIKGSEMA